MYYVYRILSKSGVYLILANYLRPEFMKQWVLYIIFDRLVHLLLQLQTNTGFHTSPVKLGVYSKPAFSFEKIRYSRFYLNSHTIERSLSEVIFDLRQSALKPQKQKTEERLLPFVTTYHPAVKKNLTKS